ncbi:MAG: DNA polymerase IV [Candidatus Bilamarchaeaceae archaeon]
MDKQRIVLHLDLDYFFAQAEEREHPEYAGKPIIVCVYTDAERGRGVVSTANYSARAFGIRSGMPIFEARKLAHGKDAIFLPGNYELYERLSFGIAELVMRYGDAFEQASIDEFFLDLSGKCNGDYRKAEEIAKRLKADILAKYKLTCSIGIGPNKLVAKIASSFKKPDGLTVVPEGKVQEFLDPLPVSDIPGIGKKTKEYFESKGIRTIRELRAVDPTILVEEFGRIIGSWLYRAARGIDDSPVGALEEQKQISRIRTLKEPTKDLTTIMTALREQIDEITQELRREELACKVVGINAVDVNMQAHTKARMLLHSTQDRAVIEKTARMLYAELLKKLQPQLRRVGVRVEYLESRKGQRVLEEF